MKQNHRDQGGVSGTVMLRALAETWAFLKELTRKLTLGEMLGWPEWRRWF